MFAKKRSGKAAGWAAQAKMPGGWLRSDLGKGTMVVYVVRSFNARGAGCVRYGGWRNMQQTKTALVQGVRLAVQVLFALVGETALGVVVE